MSTLSLMQRPPLRVLLLAGYLASGSVAAVDAPLQASNSVQSFLVHSDTQYQWSDDGKNTDPKRALDAQSNAIASWLASRPGGTPVFLNGDVTAYGHGDEWRTMLQDLADPRIPTRYWGLGNHDYANNIRLPDGSGCYNNGCARDSITHLTRAVARWGVDAFDFKVTNQGLFRVHEGSLAYSRTIGNITHIQLHNHYQYAVKFDSSSGFTTYSYTITPSLDWLEEQLRKAKEAQRFVVIHQHRPPTRLGDGPEAEKAQKRFERLVKDHRVLALFHGHSHVVAKRADVGWTPVYDSGASFRKTFLTAELDPGRNRFDVYRASDNVVESQPLHSTPLVKVFPPDVEVKKDPRGDLTVHFAFGDTRRDERVGWLEVKLGGEASAQEGGPGTAFGPLEPQKRYDYTVTAFSSKGGTRLAVFTGQFDSGDRNDPPTDLCVENIDGVKSFMTLKWQRPARFPIDAYSFVEGTSSRGRRTIVFRGPNSSNQQSNIERIHWPSHGIEDITQYDYSVYYWSASMGYTPRAILRGADLFSSGCMTR